jgi:mono/diheme cytochrome c family protein
MLKFPNLVSLAIAISFVSSAAFAGKYNLGREATNEEVAAWNIDVRPDGQGLPEGSGTVADGETIFAEKCAVCHGDFGEGVDRWPVLAGGGDTLTSDRPVKSIGSYWPYLSTVFDYVNRAMPFAEARSLESNEVYALTAYLLYVNDLVDDEEFELSKSNFLDKRLPNEANFFADDRLSSPVFDKAEPCMKDCKSEAKVIGRARILDVTPESESD